MNKMISLIAFFFLMAGANAADFKKLSTVIEHGSLTCNKAADNFLQPLLQKYSGTLFQFTSLDDKIGNCSVEMVFTGDNDIPWQEWNYKWFPSQQTCLDHKVEISERYKFIYKTDPLAVACVMRSSNAFQMLVSGDVAKVPSNYSEYQISLNLRSEITSAHYAKLAEMITHNKGQSPLFLDKFIYTIGPAFSVFHLVQYDSFTLAKDLRFFTRTQDACEKQIPEVENFLGATYGKPVLAVCKKNPREDLWGYYFYTIGNSVEQVSWWYSSVPLPQGANCMDLRESTLQYFRDKLNKNAEFAFCTANPGFILVAGRQRI